jgi:hypothetical protein
MTLLRLIDNLIAHRPQESTSLMNTSLLYNSVRATQNIFIGQGLGEVLVVGHRYSMSSHSIQHVFFHQHRISSSLLFQEFL